MTYTIRVLNAVDRPAYRAIRLESLKLHPEAFGVRYEDQVKQDKLFFEEILEEEPSNARIIGAFHGDNLVGLCSITLRGSGSAEVNQMYVQAAHRGHKLGERLLDCATSTACSALECSALQLEAKKTNVRALDTYKQYGFRIADYEGKPGNVAMTYQIPTSSK